MNRPLYRALEDELREQIHSRQLHIGERLPSIRQQCRERGISKSTVLTAYARLEAEGYISARAKSGYFVTFQAQAAGESQGLPPSQRKEPLMSPAPVSIDQVLADIMQRGAAFDILPHCSEDPFNEQLRVCLARAVRRQTGAQQHYYDEPQGQGQLRTLLAQRVSHGGGRCAADELVITSGCQHSLMLALMACTSAGDVVALESPGYYGSLQLLETLKLRVLELPSNPQQGVSPESVALAMEHWDIKAIILTPAFATPTGSRMPDTAKQEILRLAKTKNITLIEDDIYGELHFSSQRPRTLYSYDNGETVILCSSFSKCLSRDLRLGWIAAGEAILKKIRRLKLVSGLSSSATLQLGVRYFLQEGGLERHLRTRRLQYQQQYQQLSALVREHLPSCGFMSQAKGGLSVWLEFPKELDTLRVYEQARQQGILITPGHLFTSRDKYRNNLRLGFSQPWTDARIAALQQLGKLMGN